MLIVSLRKRFLHRRFARDERGVSAVEFALLAPFMIALYFGCVEISEGISADRKVSLTAAAISNLASQVNTISSTEMTNMLDASSAIIAPYDASKLTITVTCISIDASKNATAKWSVTRNGTSRSGTMTLVDALAVPNSQLILAETTYAYTPTVGFNISGTINLSDKMYMAPRQGAPAYNSTACT